MNKKFDRDTDNSNNSYADLVGKIAQQQLIEVHADRRDTHCRKIFWGFLFLIIAITTLLSVLMPKSLIISQNNQQQQSEFKQPSSVLLNQAFISSFFWLKLSFTILSISSLLLYIRNYVKTPSNEKSILQVQIIFLSVILVIFNMNVAAWEKYYTFKTGNVFTGKQQRQMAAFLGFTTFLPLFWAMFTNQILLKRPFRWGFIYEMPYFMLFFIWLLSLTIDIKNQYSCSFGISKGCKLDQQIIQQLLRFDNVFRPPSIFILYSLLPLMYCSVNIVMILKNKQTAIARNITFSMLFIPISVFFYVFLAYNGLFYLDLCSQRVVIVHFVVNSYIIALQILYSTTSKTFGKIQKKHNEGQYSFSITTSLMSQQIILQSEREQYEIKH